METPKKLEEESVKRFDFTTPELEYILNNANFTVEQEEIFKMLTSKYGRASIVNIAMKMNMSESTVKRRIKQIKSKILRLL
ncbi:MAG: HTH domain-containing protein [Cytophagales bacterium]|nr:HTH domain-containing protein [Cytophagales bacterium]